MLLSGLPQWSRSIRSPGSDRGRPGRRRGGTDPTGEAPLLSGDSGPSALSREEPYLTELPSPLEGNPAVRWHSQPCLQACCPAHVRAPWSGLSLAPAVGGTWAEGQPGTGLLNADVTRNHDGVNASPAGVGNGVPSAITVEPTAAAPQSLRPSTGVSPGGVAPLPPAVGTAAHVHRCLGSGLSGAQGRAQAEEAETSWAALF